MPTQMEKVASKTMGAMKKAKGTIEGLSGVFKTLMEEHGEVSAMLLRVKGSDDLETRARLWATIRKELVSHEKGEVAIVYPMYEQFPETSPFAAQHNEEANRLASLIGRIEELDIDAPTWPVLFEQLVELVQHHVQEEESTIFPAGQKAFGERAEELNASYLAKKKEAFEQL